MKCTCDSCNNFQNDEAICLNRFPILDIYNAIQEVKNLMKGRYDDSTA